MKIALGDYSSAYLELRDPETGRYHSGTGVMVHEADVSMGRITDLMLYEVGDGWKSILRETQHLVYKPRVKNCSNFDGFGCDLEGDWHAHWFPVRHNDQTPGCCWTTAVPIWPTPEELLS